MKNDVLMKFDKFLQNAVLQIKFRRMKMINKGFPEGFLWGGAVAAHQLEGDCWSTWSSQRNY